MIQELPRPRWISKIQSSDRDVLLHLQLTSAQRQQLQFSTDGDHRARLERLDTGEVWMLPLSAGCRSAKWTRDGLKLTLEDAELPGDGREDFQFARHVDRSDPEDPKESRRIRPETSRGCVESLEFMVSRNTEQQVEEKGQDDSIEKGAMYILMIFEG